MLYFVLDFKYGRRHELVQGRTRRKRGSYPKQLHRNEKSRVSILNKIPKRKENSFDKLHRSNKG